MGRAALGAPWGRSSSAGQAVLESEATGNISNTDPHVKVLIFYHVLLALISKSIALDCDLTWLLSSLAPLNFVPEARASLA